MNQDIEKLDEMIANQENEQAASTLTDWVNPPKLVDLKSDYQDALSDHDSQMIKINKWLDNLKVTGEAKKAKVKGKSNIVPKLIRKQAEWRYAALSEPFLSTTDIFNTDPVTYEDKTSAIQNGLVLNNQLNTKINKTKFIDEYVRTAVDEGTVIVRVGWDCQEKVEEVEVPVIQQVPVQDPIMAQQMIAQGQQPYQDVQVGTELQEQIVDIVKNCPTLEVCDNASIMIDPSCQGNLDEAQFIIYEFETSLSALEKEGKYQNLNRINIDNNSILSKEDSSLNEPDSSFNFKDKPRKKFTAFEYWGYWDINDTGIVEPIIATYVGDVLIRLEENPFPDKKLPFVAVQYLPVRKSVYGEPDGELLEDNQRIIGAVTRGMIDVMGRSANGQMGSRKDALDVTNKRKFEKGMDYEFNPQVDPRQAFHMHTFPEIPQSAHYMLELQNNEAEAITGVKAFSQGISGQSLGALLDINTLIPMSDGTFKKLTNIEDNDVIIGSNGGFTTVTKAHEIQYPKAAYDITFSSGATIKSGVEHLWTVKVTGSKRKLREWHTVDTGTMFKYYLESIGKKDVNVYIPRITRPRTSKTSVSLDPYVLGAWLGDGNSHGARFTSEDPEIINRFSSAGYNFKESVSQNSGNAVNYDVMDESGNIRDSKTGQFISNTDTLHNKLKELNLLKRYGGIKHIPEEYFEADYYVKLELLRGLMDTDGYAHSGSFNIFCQTEGQLLDDFIRLIYSMGSIPKITKIVTADESNQRKSKSNSLNIKSNKTLYEIGFTLLDNPFYLKRKAKKYKSPTRTNTYRITDMVEVGKVLMKCLTVDSADKLYAVGKEYTLTHNTATGIRSALDATSKRELGILRRLSEGLISIGRKIISMNGEFLSDTEVVRVTNEEFVPVKRDDLAGNIDLRLTISTAEADNEKAQELAFMLQTTAQSSDPEEVRMIRAEIARLRKMPDLAKKIEQFQPQPDPLAEKAKELELMKLEAEIRNEQAKAAENEIDRELKMAKTKVELAKAKQLAAQADLADLEFLEKESGVDHQRDLEKQEFKLEGDLYKERAKQLSKQAGGA